MASDQQKLLIMRQTFSTNPLYDSRLYHKQYTPCIVVIFGATGDLTSRKLIPALYHLMKEEYIDSRFCCVGFARRPKDDDIFRQEMHTKLFEKDHLDSSFWPTFSQHLFYHRSEFENDEGYLSLSKRLDELDNAFGTQANRIFYLSTPPSHHMKILSQLNKHNLIQKNLEDTPWTRFVIEKPFGHDFESASILHSEISSYLSESQIYRIDHWLGKEPVQNLLYFRWSNPIFEKLWNRDCIDHVQITISEDIGIGTRGNFFEEAGILRDIFQNHALQLLSLTAMNLPEKHNSDAIRDEKVNVLKSLRDFDSQMLDQDIIRAQYSKGFLEGIEANAYLDEPDVNPESCTETYAAIKCHIDNERWKDVPFYVRCGKRLCKKSTEIAIYFKPTDGDQIENLFSTKKQNVLLIQIQPQEGISLRHNCKTPGFSPYLYPVLMDFSYQGTFGKRSPEAYERLIYDCMLGDNTLFARYDEVLEAWRYISPILDHWKNNGPKNLFKYNAGSSGPDSANTLLEKDERSWRKI